MFFLTAAAPPDPLPFWESWWFIFGIILTLASIAFGLGSGWWNAVRDRNRRLEELVEQRTEELRVINQTLVAEVIQREQAEAELARRAEEELHQSEARFQAIFQSSVMGIGVLSLERRLIDVNPAFCAMLGYSADELKAINYADLVYSDDVALDADAFQSLLTGETDYYTIEKRYRRKDGTYIWCRGTISIVRDRQKQPRYIAGMLEDITLQKQAQEDLRESEARFRAMFDNTAVGMALMGLDRNVLAVNQAASRIIGYSTTELLYINPVDITYAEDRAVNQEEFKDLVMGRCDHFQADRRYIRKDGRVLWCRLTYSLVRDASGNPLYLVGIIEDIDEQKRADERLASQEAEYRRTLEQRVEERTRELLEANERLQSEIQQRQRAEEALAAQAAEAAVANERNRLARDLHDAVTQTLFSASLLADVIPDLWEINQTEARNRLEELRQLTRGALAEMRTLLMELRPAALTHASLPELLRQLTEAVIGRARLPVELTMEGECCLTPEVQVALYRIAQEALNNVVKYAKATQVNVALRLTPEAVRLSVLDNGIGFDPAAVPPNHLGLRIMRERAEGIGARLSIYSEPGEGTQVTAVWENPVRAEQPG